MSLTTAYGVTTLYYNAANTSWQVNTALPTPTTLARARMTKTVAQNITNTTSKVTFTSTPSYNIGNIGDSGTSRVTVAQAGIYAVNANVEIVAPASGSGNVCAIFYVNGAPSNLQQCLPANFSNGATYQLSFSDVLNLSAGDFLEVFLQNQNGVAAQVTAANTTYTVQQQPTAAVSIQSTAASYILAKKVAVDAPIADTTKFPFDTAANTAGADITLSSGTFTLKAGHTYKLESSLSSSDSGVITNYQWRDTTNNVFLGIAAVNYTTNAAIAQGDQQVATAIITPTTDITVEVWNTTGSPRTFVGANSYAYINEIAGNSPVIGSSVDYVSAVRGSSNQAGITTGTDLVWNSVSAGNIALNTGTGVFTLSAGKTYKLSAGPRFVNYSAANLNTVFEWVDAVGNTQLSTGAGIGTQYPMTATDQNGMQGVAELIYTPATNQTVKVRVTVLGGTADLQVGSWVNITQLGSSALTQDSVVAVGGNAIGSTVQTMSIGSLTSNALSFITNGIQRLFVASSTYGVGIGTSNTAGSVLTVATTSTTSSVFALSQGNSTANFFIASGTPVGVASVATGSLAIDTANGRLYIASGSGTSTWAAVGASTATGSAFTVQLTDGFGNLISANKLTYSTTTGTLANTGTTSLATTSVAFFTALNGNATLTNATTTNFASTNTNAGTLAAGTTTLGTTTISTSSISFLNVLNTLWANTLSFLNLTGTNATITNATSSNIAVGNLTATGTTALATTTIGTSTIASSTINNANIGLLSAGTSTLGSTTVNGNLTVNGNVIAGGTTTIATETVASSSITNLNVLATLWANVLTVLGFNATNATITNATTSNIAVGNLTATGSVIVGGTTALATTTIGTSTINSATILNGSANLSTGTITNATATNFASTNTNAGTLTAGTTTLGTTTISTGTVATLNVLTNLFAAVANILGLTSTNATITNATTTNLFANSLNVSSTTQASTTAIATFRNAEGISNFYIASGTPSGITPVATGSLAIDSASGNLYIARGIATSSWIAVGTGAGSGSASATGTVGSIQFTDGSNLAATSTFVVATTSGTAYLGIGTSTPDNALTVVGNISNLIQSGSPASAVGNVTVSTNPKAVVTVGKIAYVAGSLLNKLQAIDLSNPSAPVVLSTVSVGTTPSAVAVGSRYAYVSNTTTNSITVVDISNPSNLQNVATVTSAFGTSPVSLALSGRYLFAANSGNGYLTVFDMLNPTSPAEVASLAVGTQPVAIAIQGRYAYLADSNQGNVVVVDISNPLSPVQLGTATTGTNPTGITVQGRYVYSTNNGDNTFSVVDVSNPSAPVEVGTGNTGTSPTGIFVAGRYVVTADQGGNTISINDATNVASPVLVKTIAVTGGPISVSQNGRYLQVVTFSGNKIVNIDLGGTETSNLTAGTVDAGRINSQDGITANGNISTLGAIFSGIGGIFTQGSIFGKALGITGNASVGTTTVAASTTLTVSALSAAAPAGLTLAAWGTGTTTGFASTSQLRFGAPSGNYVGFQAPGVISTSTVWTLPGGDGVSGQILVTNGQGTLTWGSAAVAAGNNQLQFTSNAGSQTATGTLSYVTPTLNPYGTLILATTSTTSLVTGTGLSTNAIYAGGNIVVGNTKLANGNTQGNAIVIESATTSFSATTNALYNNNGTLYWNGVLKKAYGQIKEELNKKVSTVSPEVPDLNQKYADLVSAELAIANRDAILKRANIVPFFAKVGGAAGLVGLGTAAFSGVGLIPILTAAGVAGVESALASTAFKTRMAKWLGDTSPTILNKFFMENPAIKEAIYRTIPKAASLIHKEPQTN